jgi:hypothetical protein
MTGVSFQEPPNKSLNKRIESTGVSSFRELVADSSSVGEAALQVAVELTYRAEEWLDRVALLPHRARGWLEGVLGRRCEVGRAAAAAEGSE